MAKLTYTSESKGFKYEDGDYSLTGNKVSSANELRSIDGGQITKKGIYVGSFNVRFEGESQKLSTSNIPMDEYEGAIAQIRALIVEIQK